MIRSIGALLQATALTSFVVGASSPAVRAQGASMTLDSVLAAPFVDELTVSPKRDALAWTVHERGARNVAVWTRAGGARLVTHVAADDGQEIDAPQLTPDDTAVVYARGGAGQDGGGDNPNPTAPTTHLARRILMTSLVNGATVEIGKGREPVLSPSGDRVAWIGADNQLALATIASHDGGRTWKAGPARKPFAVRGSVDAPLWSPDGTRIAVVSNRGDHAFVAIYALGATSLVYAAPGFGNDGAAAWSADSTKIAFVRQPPTVPNLTFYDDPSLFAPWSIVVADARSGLGGEVWRAKPGRGSEFSIADGVQPLFWSPAGDLAFVWERDGWRHLYSLRDGRGEPALLTPGSFDIEQIATGPSGLIYTSNQDDLDARHAWIVPFRDGAPSRVAAPDDRNQWSPVELANRRVAYVDSSFSTPGTVTLAPTASSSAIALRAVPLASGFPSALLVKPQKVVFSAPDGLQIHGQLFVPRGAGKHPG